MKHVELFAGCGGLALGLQASGSDLIFANEISAMAGETFAFNLLNEDISASGKSSENVFWLDSNFSTSETALRRSKDPATSSSSDARDGVDANSASITNKLLGSLILGDIAALNRLLEQDDLAKRIVLDLGDGDIDLVSGGPPCQSFSLAGLRQRSHLRNQLPLEFVRSVDLLRPKIAVLENVSGILNAFKDENAEYFAWFEVAKAFANSGYLPLCLLVNAKHLGIPQNRPRFLLFALRENFAASLRLSCNGALRDALTASSQFLKLVKKKGIHIPYQPDLLRCYDSSAQGSIFREEPFKEFVACEPEDFVSVSDAIDDLCPPSGKKLSRYVKNINNSFGFRLASHGHPANTAAPKNSSLVKARFRLYQLLRDLKPVAPQAAKKIADSLRENDTDYQSLVCEIDQLRASNWMLNAEGKTLKFATREQVKEVLSSIKTKKQTQRALVASEPAPAALTIPDDICHYDADCLRTLSVRELARIQSFPDWFVFRSKVTTGGRLRRFQVPQYTQVGNAVPPLLGKSIGEVCKTLLQMADEH